MTTRATAEATINQPPDLYSSPESRVLHDVAQLHKIFGGLRYSSSTNTIPIRRCHQFVVRRWASNPKKWVGLTGS